MYQAKQSKHVAKYTPKQVKYLFNSLDKYSQHMALKDLCTRLVTIKKVSYHLQYKVHTKQVYIPKWALQAIIQHNHYKVIEVNITGKDIRYLLRGTDSFYCRLSGKVHLVNLCIVVSTKSRLIITAYLNKCTDNHSTLNTKR
ncbi:hypothetical protein LGL73_13655, partial [Staphylococcus aureus]|uniref:hypothetical protein n=1 Tax=Staphylococcus aureus TaxID=1280 RepID=UPI001CF3D091